MKKLVARLSGANYIYLLVHVILFLAGSLLLRVEGVLWPAVGSSLIATGLTGWVVFIYLFSSDETRERVAAIHKAGLTQILRSRGSTVREVYDQKLASARANIDILGFGQNTLREDFLHEFVAWKGRAVVRILLIDPEYPSAECSFANARDKEEGSQIGKIAVEVESFLRDVRSIRDARFQVRLYKCLPAVSVFRVDDELLWGPYLAKRVSRNSPTLIVERGGFLFEALNAHFDAIWSDDSLSREAPP